MKESCRFTQVEKVSRSHFYINVDSRASVQTTVPKYKLFRWNSTLPKSGKRSGLSPSDKMKLVWMTSLNPGQEVAHTYGRLTPPPLPHPKLDKQKRTDGWMDGSLGSNKYENSVQLTYVLVSEQILSGASFLSFRSVQHLSSNIFIAQAAFCH